MDSQGSPRRVEHGRVFRALDPHGRAVSVVSPSPLPSEPPAQEKHCGGYPQEAGWAVAPLGGHCPKNCLHIVGPELGLKIKITKKQEQDELSVARSPAMHPLQAGGLCLGGC